MPEKLRDYVPRGRTESTPLGTTIFCGLRALDPLLQRSLLLSAPLASLIPYFGRSAANTPPAGGDVITTAGLGLTPFQAVIWGMSVGSAVKHEPGSLPHDEWAKKLNRSVVVHIGIARNSSCRVHPFLIRRSDGPFRSRRWRRVADQLGVRERDGPDLAIFARASWRIDEAAAKR